MNDIFIYLLIAQTAVIGILVLVVGIVLKEYPIEVINNQKKIENELRKTPIEKACERCEEGNLDTCDNTLSCPVYALYVEATKKEKVVYKQDGWQEPPTPKAEMILNTAASKLDAWINSIRINSSHSLFINTKADKRT